MSGGYGTETGVLCVRHVAKHAYSGSCLYCRRKVMMVVVDGDLVVDDAKDLYEGKHVW